MYRKVISYSVGLYAAALFGSLVRVVVKSMIAKSLGKEALGAYAYYSTVMVLATTLLAFGLKRAVAKEVAARKDEATFAPLVTAVLAVFAVASLVLGGAALLFYGRLEWIYVLILAGVGPATLFDIACSTLRGQFDQKREIAALVLGVLTQAACIVTLVMLSQSPRAPVWGLTTAYILLGLATLFYFGRRYRQAWKPIRVIGVLRSSEFKWVAMLSAPIWVAEILGFVSQQADQLIVQNQLGFSMLAEYAAAFTFIGLMDQPISILSRVFLVTFAGGYYSDIDQYKQVTSLNLMFFSLVGFGLILFAYPLTPIFFTAEYTLTPALVTILSATSIFNSVELVNSSLTIAQDYPQANRNAKIITLALYLPLTFFMVAKYQVFGAAISNVASWAIYALVHSVYMGRRLPQHGRHSLRILTLGAGLYIAVTSLFLILKSPWVILAAIPAYFLAGQVLQLWDLVKLPGMVLRLLPQKTRLL